MKIDRYLKLIDWFWPILTYITVRLIHFVLFRQIWFHNSYDKSDYYETSNFDNQLPFYLISEANNLPGLMTQLSSNVMTVFSALIGWAQWPTSLRQPMTSFFRKLISVERDSHFGFLLQFKQILTRSYYWLLCEHFFLVRLGPRKIFDAESFLRPVPHTSWISLDTIGKS